MPHSPDGTDSEQLKLGGVCSEVITQKNPVSDRVKSPVADEQGNVDFDEKHFFNKRIAGDDDKVGLWKALVKLGFAKKDFETLTKEELRRLEKELRNQYSEQLEKSLENQDRRYRSLY